MIGKVKGNDQYTLSEYLEITTEVNNVFGVLHILFVTFMVAFFIQALIRKSRLSPYKWFQLGELLVLNCIEIFYFFAFDKAMISDNCGSK